MDNKTTQRGLNVLRVGSLKKILRECGLQSTGEALVQIDRDVTNIIRKYGKDQAGQGIKRLNGDTSLGTVNTKTNHKHDAEVDTEIVDSVYGKSCKRCANITDAFLRKARSESRWFYDEIKAGVRAFTKGKKYNPLWATKNGRVNNIL